MRSTGCNSGVLTVFSYFLIITVHYVWLYCALASCRADSQCVVIGPVFVFLTAGGRAGGVRTLLQPARAVFASLCALFHYSCIFCDVSGF